jgi:hypothetical protein
MDTEIIRYFGAAYIMESNLSPKKKCDLIDYVKEAEWDQILNLVFNGDPPTRKLTVNEQYILEAQAENFIYPLIFRYMEEGKKKRKGKPSGAKGLGLGIDPTTGEAFFDPSKIAEKPRKYAKKGYEATKGAVIKHGPQAKRFAKGASVAIMVAAASAAGQRIYKVYLSKAARQCSGLGGTQKRDCMVKFRKVGYQAKMNSYIKAKHDCGSSKDPQRCQRDLDTKIKKVRYKMGTLYSRL